MASTYLVSKKGKRFYDVSRITVHTDFNFIDNVVEGLISSLNFNYKKSNFPQVWEMGSGKKMSVKKFALIIWNKLKPSSKIIFSKIKDFDKKSFKIDKKNHWKIKYTHPSLTINSFK